MGISSTTDSISTTALSPAPDPATGPHAGDWRRAVRARLHKRQVQRTLVNLGALALLIAYVQIRTGLFLTTRNLEQLSIEIAVMVVCASAVTLVMVAGSIDVSVPGVVALTGIVAALLNSHGVALLPAFLIAILCGTVVGFVNSVLVLTVGITSMIATIGTLYVTEGVGELMTNGNTVSGSSSQFGAIGAGYSLGIPNALFLIAGSVVLFTALQRWTTFGRHVVAAGSNAQAAFLNGVRVKRVTTICFLLSGTAAGFGGVIYASRVGTAVPQIDNDLLFQVIVACVIGGTSLTGGEGTVFGTFVGCVLIGSVNNSLDILGISTFWQDIALGGLLVAAVGLDVGLRQEGVARLRRRQGVGGLAMRGRATSARAARLGAASAAPDPSEGVRIGED